MNNFSSLAEQFQLARTASEQGNYVSALEGLLAIVKDSPSAALWNQIGNLYFKVQEYAPAHKAYQSALMLDPNYREAQFNDALLWIHSKEEIQAIAAFESYLKCYPHDDRTLFHLANLYLGQDRGAEAIIYYQKLLSHPEYALEAYSNMGASYVKQSDWKQALQAFSTVLRMDENHIAARSNLAAVLMITHRYRDAVWHYQQLLRLTPEDLTAHYNVGVGWLHLHEIPKAIESFLKVLEVQPDCMEAHWMLGTAYHKNACRSEALTHYQAALVLDPNNAAIAYMIAALSQSAEQAPVQAPSEYIARLFDDYADTYDRHLVEGLHYKAPELLYQAVLAVCPKLHEAIMLDLGCGTGLCGERFAPHVRSLLGVDISEGMLTIAREKNVYHMLWQEDMLSAIKNISEHTDEMLTLITAADVWIYVGDLLPLLKACREILDEKGILAFTIEQWIHPTTNIAYRLTEHGRYQHNTILLRTQCESLGWKVLKCEDALTRTQDHVPVKGQVWVLGCK